MGFTDFLKKATVPGLLGLMDKPDPTTVTQTPFLTDEQAEAQKLLLDFAKTGRTPTGFQAGQAFDTSQFNFDPSQTELAGSNRLLSLIQGGTPDGINTARNRLSELANMEFNPDDPSNGFAAFKRQAARATQDANDVLNREAAITGDRFGSRILAEKGDLAAQQSDLITGRLAELFNASQNRALSASQGLIGLEGTNEAIEQGRINQALTQGAIQRDLQNAKAQLEFDEFNRKRNEQLNAFTGGTSTIFNKGIDFGVRSVTTQEPSVFSKLLNVALQAGGAALGGAAGKKLGGSFGNLFSGSTTTLG